MVNLTNNNNDKRVGPTSSVYEYLKILLCMDLHQSERLCKSALDISELDGQLDKQPFRRTNSQKLFNEGKVL